MIKIRVILFNKNDENFVIFTKISDKQQKLNYKQHKITGISIN